MRTEADPSLLTMKDIVYGQWSKITLVVSLLWPKLFLMLDLSCMMRHNWVSLLLRIYVSLAESSPSSTFVVVSQWVSVCERSTEYRKVLPEVFKLLQSAIKCLDKLRSQHNRYWKAVCCVCSHRRDRKSPCSCSITLRCIPAFAAAELVQIMKS